MTKKILILSIAIITIALVLLASSLYAYTNAEGIQNGILRLHVLANSDSKEDQELKLKIRDTVIDYFRRKFDDSKDKQELMENVKKNLEGINTYVTKSISQLGSEYKATTVLTKSVFPTKNYGEIVLPPGEYDALKITIGKGEGKNWWCVLFPPVCIADARPSCKEPEKRKNDSYALLKNSLTEEEYNLVTASANGEVPIKVKFKVLEFFQDSKIKLSMLREQLF